MVNPSPRPRLIVTLGWMVALVGVFAAQHPTALQQPPPSAPQGQARFRVQVELVQVDVFPTDADGRIVTALMREDFEVLEDGRPQVVSTFEFVNIPIAGTDPSRPLDGSASAVSDVQVNASSGRLYAIVLDDVHTGRAYSAYVQALAIRFIERWMEPGDVAAVVYTSGNGALSQGFTSDRTRLVASVRRFQGTGAGRTRDAIATLTGLSEYLGGIKGRRKACVYFSQGFPSPASGSVFKDLTDAANRGNVSMYTMNPGGLADLAGLTSADQPSVLQTDPVSPDVRTRHPGDERDREAGMRWLADATGGFAIVGTNELDRGLDRIRMDVSSYYLLGYYPTNARRPGAEHKITVRLRNRPGVIVRARQGYVEPGRTAASAPPAFVTKGVPARLLPALQYPAPQVGIRLSATAAPFMNEAGSPWAAVAIQFDGHDLDLSPSGTLDVAVLAIDARGAVRGHDVRRLDLSFDAAARARVVEGGLRTQARVQVTPGAIGIRIAAADGSGQKVGSVWFDLDVPDFGRVPLSMSGIVLSASAENAVPTANADEDLRQALQSPVSTRRQFGQADTVAWLAEVYRAETRNTGVEITTTIRAAGNGREVFRRPGQAGARDRVVRVVQRASLAGCVPGAYVLRIEARLADTGETVARELAFRVVDAVR